MAKKAQPASRPSLIVVDALMALAAERGWLAVSLADIAERAGLSLADLHDQYPSKSAILAAYRESLDVAVLRGDPLDREASSRDRLFDVVMRRFDAMQPHRDGIRAILRDSMVDPWGLLCGAPHLLGSAALMLEAAGISASGPAGRLKTKGLAAVYLSILRTWLGDDAPDMGKTMAALDRALRRIESVALFVCRTRRSPPSGGEHAEAVKS